MNKLFLAILLIIFTACNSKQERKSGDSSLTKINDTVKSGNVRSSTYSKKAVDSLIRAGLISPDSIPDAPPSQSEEREKLTKKYDQIETVDSTFISNNDTLHLHIKYYCLKNINLIEPKLYDPDTKTPKEFVTHPFAADILLIHNSDTVLKKQFKASDLNPFFTDNFGGDLKKYGSLLSMPEFARKNKDQSRIVLDFPIAIPATDLGLGQFLIISKNGDYKFAEKY
jgi:hypothetical protein